MNLYGHGIPHKKGFGIRVKCTACEGSGQTRYEEKEPEPRRRRSGRPRRGHPQKSRTENQGKFWYDSEINILKECFETDSKEEIMAKLPKRTWRAIRKQASRMKLDRGHLKWKSRKKKK
ncbi:unnamed protein product [marine sediment metagenome]|uniref:Uncharacterized protein n=1 Tax=marine sediment metagenome TaxID=412755 RepID=X0WSM9_9ZZZZ